MRAQASTYPDWKAPAEDGGVLIWPQPATLLHDARANHHRLSSLPALIQNVPLAAIRQRARAFIGHANKDQPLLATGHQTELYHPGVWVKEILIDRAARALDGQAYHIAVDTDAPKHLMLRWPGGTVPITDDPQIASAPWSGLLAPSTPAHLQQIDGQLDDASKQWSFEPLAPAVLASLRRLSLESTSLASSLTNALHELDWSLGLRNHALLASPIWASEPFLLFAHHVLSRADRFAVDYNASLADYRAAHGLNTKGRPMPDLFVSDAAIEAPFWLDDLSSSRRSRPSVFRCGDAYVLQLLGGEEFAFDPRANGWEAAGELQRWLTSVNHRLAPRALMLTTFCRLLLADLFVHGIGGGRYDQVTDRLIQRHFAIEPPKFGVTTATMLFPDALGHERACLPCVLHEGHRLKHAVLGPKKLEFVRRIESLPRGSAQRSETFTAMHHALDEAVQSSTAVERWHAKLQDTLAQQKHEQALFDRELFYAIQPRERLEQMIERYSSFVPRASRP